MEKIKLYVKDAANELLYKVSWPTWEELQSSATVVLISSLLVALLVFFMDFIFGANPENSWFSGILYYVYELFR